MIQSEAVRLKIKNKRVLIIWLTLSAIWMIIIFLFSAQTGEQSESQSGFIVDLVKKLIPFPLSDDGIVILSFVIRKLAHFMEYAVLGFFYIMTIMALDKFVRMKLEISTLLCLIYAMSDEFHQSFVGGRAPAVRDVLIDTAGGLFGGLAGLLAVYLIMKKRGSKNDSEKNGRICGE